MGRGPVDGLQAFAFMLLSVMSLYEQLECEVESGLHCQLRKDHRHHQTRFENHQIGSNPQDLTGLRVGAFCCRLLLSGLKKGRRFLQVVEHHQPQDLSCETLSVSGLTEQPM